MLHKDSVDLQAVEAKLKQIESLKTDLHLSMIKAREEIKAKLTPEQRKKLKSMMVRGDGDHGRTGMHHGEKMETR
jgi:Spy/CpxP family protein refolding chaperone